MIINFQSQNTTITVTDYDNKSDNSHDSATGNNTTNSSKPCDDECDHFPICTLHNIFFACYGIMILLSCVKCSCTRLYKTTDVDVVKVVGKEYFATASGKT